MEKIAVLKVVIAGDGNVGKTSLVRRYCEGKFEASRVATIGVDFQTKVVELPAGTVKLSIWDMAGQDRFAVVRSGFYRGSLAAALVYDVTDPESLEDLGKWYQEINGITPGQKFIVIGNKIDLERTTQAEVASAFAGKIAAPYLETSALSGEGVAEMFTALATLASSHLSFPQNEKVD
ncbi:MAG: GTP-binding protein [Anaerolineaceae bacterium]|nr:MAG: GTP-binding protein [Anaerolineaceae bacterium]